ncbi:MAG TPA: exo-alpha-sialidase, partial [bacterium]|nr:exo-alpha-sialidase [bacterium]
MKRYNRLFVAAGITAAAVLLALTLLPERPKAVRETRIRSTQSPKASRASRFGRVEYYQRLLRDPATGRIPEDIRRRELAFARNLPRAEQRLAKGSAAQFTWKSAGPTDVGGRVRALAVNISNSSTVLAGSVSGGIWKSTDSGATWALKNTPGQNLAVTSLAQDTRSGHTGTWYYATGEFDGSAYDRGARAFVYGAGVYKSTNGGETWTELPWAQGDNNPTAWSYPTNYISRLVVHPSNGYVFVASHAYGIFRSTDGGASWGYVLGGVNQGNFHYYADVALTSDGRVVAALSNSYWGSSTSSFGGIYVSSNYGGSWTDVTPSTFP